MPHQCFALFSYGPATCQNHVIYKAFVTVSFWGWPHTHPFQGCFVSGPGDECIVVFAITSLLIDIKILLKKLAEEIISGVDTRHRL